MNRNLLASSDDESFEEILGGQLKYPRWKKTFVHPLYQRNSHTCIIYKDFMIIHGGHNGDHSLNDTLICNLKTLKWERLMVSKKTMRKRYGHTACLYEDSNRIIYFGGKSAISSDLLEEVLDDIMIATINELDGSISIDWEMVDMHGKTTIYRRSHTAHVYNRNMYVIGGVDQEKKPRNEVWCLDAEYNWTLKKIYGDVFTVGETKSALYKNRAFIYGGNSVDGTKHGSNQFYVLDLETFEGKFLYLEGNPAPRFSHTMEQCNGKLYIFGGCSKRVCTNELYTFEIEKEEWQMVSAGGDDPDPVGNHTCVSYGASLIVFGGENGKGVVNKMYTLEIGEKEETKSQIYKAKMSHYVEHMKTLYGNKKFSDVCFEVEGEEFYCHKNILAARCKFFDGMFSSEMAESNAEKIQITDIKASIFQELVKFIYCDEVRLEEENAFELLTLADKYFVDDLKVTCEEYLIKTLTLENFASRAKVAETFEMRSLKRTLVDFGMRNMGKLRQRGILEDLSSQFLADIIYKLYDKISIIEKNKNLEGDKTY